MTHPLIDIQSITHSFPDGEGRRVVLDSVSLQVRPGELVALMGRSGSGKSTLLNVVSGMLRPEGGDVHIDRESIARAPNSTQSRMRRSSFGIVHQRNSLVEALSIKENIALPIELNGTKPRTAFALAQLALDSHGLSAIAAKRPSQVSGGQRQLAAVLAALSAERQVLLADEPTGALDSVAGDSVMQLIRAHIDAGRAGLVVTHDARDAAWADRIVYLEDGVIASDTGYAADLSTVMSEGDQT